VLLFFAALYGSFLIGCAYITASPGIYLAVPFDYRSGHGNECSLDMSFDGRVWSNVRTPLYTAPSPALCRNASLFKLGSTYMMTYSSFLPSGTITGQSTSFGLASGSDPLHLTHLTEVSLASCCMGVETASPIVDEAGELHVIVNAWTGQESGDLKLWEVHNDSCTFADQSGCGSGWSDPVALQCATQSGCGNPDGSIRALDPSMVSMGGEYYLIAGGERSFSLRRRHRSLDHLDLSRRWYQRTPRPAARFELDQILGAMSTSIPPTTGHTTLRQTTWRPVCGAVQSLSLFRLHTAIHGEPPVSPIWARCATCLETITILESSPWISRESCGKEARQCDHFSSVYAGFVFHLSPH
jgi:hypothetical protein